MVFEVMLGTQTWTLEQGNSNIIYTEKGKEKEKKKSTRETEIRNRETEKMKTGWYANVSILSKFIAKERERRG